MVNVDRISWDMAATAFLVAIIVGCTLGKTAQETGTAQAPQGTYKTRDRSAPSRIPTVLKVQRLAASTGDVIGTGSGVPIARRGSYTWVLTVRHNLPAQQVGGYPVAETIVHPTLDLALLRVALGSARQTFGKRSLNVRPIGLIRIAKAAPVPGDHLRAIGWFLSNTLAMTDGRSRPEPGGMTCPILWGTSGGAVLNDQGELVGVIKDLRIYKAPGFPKLPAPWLSRYVPVTSEAVREWITKETSI